MTALPKPSLIERAAEIYDFEAALRGRARPAPAPVVEPAAAAAPEPVAPVVPATPAPVRPRPAFGSVAAVDRAGLEAAGFIRPEDPTGGLAEEFRIAKRQLLLSALGASGSPAVPRGRLMLVCSAEPDEGKTFCAVNLALSMAAEREVEVLLVDADLAKPDVLATLGLAEGPGLMDAVLDPTVDPETLVRRTDVPQLSVLPAGRRAADVTEQLASDRTRVVLDRLLDANPRRLVLIDSPPALAASPASVLALHVGQAVLVVRADRTTEADLRDAYAMLARCDTIHLLLNRVSYGGGRRRFGSYYGVEL